MSFPPSFSNLSPPSDVLIATRSYIFLITTVCYHAVLLVFFATQEEQQEAGKSRVVAVAVAIDAQDYIVFCQSC